MYSKLPIICVQIIHAWLFFYINADTCIRLSISFHTCFGEESCFRKDLQKTWSNNTYFLCFTVSTSGGVGRRVPVVMVGKRGYTTGVLSLFQISVSCSQFCYVELFVNMTGLWGKKKMVLEAIYGISQAWIH
jgi:hypothetical protein